LLFKILFVAEDDDNMRALMWVMPIQHSRLKLVQPQPPCFLEGETSVPTVEEGDDMVLRMLKPETLIYGEPILT
jgi:hypothetical protein